MRTKLSGVILAASALPLLSIESYAACNIRGEFCGRPGWAANAFSNPRDRYPEDALDNPTTRSVHHHSSDRRKVRRKDRSR